MRNSIAVVAGFAVLATGLVALSGQTGPVEAPPVETTTTVPVAAASTTVVEVPSPDLDGIDARVQRVLYSMGMAEAVTLEQLAELPPAVGRILIEHGVTLTVPEPASGGQG